MLGLFGGLGSAVQEAILVAVAAILLVLLILLGAEYLEIKSLKEDVSQLQQKNATCEASVAQLKGAVDHQNEAVDAAKREGEAAKQASKVQVEEAQKAAAKAILAANLRAKAQLAGKPSNPNDLCGSAQKANAEFLKARQ